MSRRPARLIIEESPDELKTWRVRLKDGQTRGPLSTSGLQSLVEMKLLDESSEISAHPEAEWVPIRDHEVWRELRPAAPPLTLRGNASVPPIPPPPAPNSTVVVNLAVTPRRAEEASVVRAKEEKQARKALGFWYLGRLLRSLRELLVFLVFAAAGDLAGSFIDPTLGVLRWVVLICVCVAALGYYSYRSLE